MRHVDALLKYSLSCRIVVEDHSWVKHRYGLAVLHL